MKKISKMTALLLGTVALGFSVASLTQTPKAQDQVAEAATAQTDRRIYVWTKDAWGYNENLYIHYWGGAETDFNAAPAMTRVLSDYWNGLYYYDVPIATTGFLLKNATSGDGSVKTSDIAISYIFNGADYLALETWGGGGANFAQTTVSMSEAQAAAILNKIDSCSTSYASGQNAWPQLNDLFIASNGLKNSTQVVTDDFGPDTTIANKTTWLEQKYNADQASGANPFIVVTPDNKRLSNTIIILGLVSVAALGFVSIRKKA